MSDYVQSQIGQDICDKRLYSKYNYDTRETVYEIKLDNEKKTKLNIIKMLAFYVAVNLGKGRDEGVYQKALCHELQKNNILNNQHYLNLK